MNTKITVGQMVVECAVGSRVKITYRGEVYEIDCSNSGDGPPAMAPSEPSRTKSAKKAQFRIVGWRELSKIPAIKLVREYTGLGLRDAKDIVENHSAFCIMMDDAMAFRVRCATAGVEIKDC